MPHSENKPSEVTELLNAIDAYQLEVYSAIIGDETMKNSYKQMFYLQIFCLLASKMYKMNYWK